MFEWAGCDIVTHVSMFPSKADVVVADASVVKVHTLFVVAHMTGETHCFPRFKEITTSRSRFPKAVALYGAFSFFGSNILVSEGEVWKRYRKISAPSFSEVFL